MPPDVRFVLKELVNACCIHCLWSHTTDAHPRQATKEREVDSGYPQALPTHQTYARHRQQHEPPMDLALGCWCLGHEDPKPLLQRHAMATELVVG